MYCCKINPECLLPYHLTVRLLLLTAAGAAAVQAYTSFSIITKMFAACCCSAPAALCHLAHTVGCCAATNCTAMWRNAGVVTLMQRYITEVGLLRVDNYYAAHCTKRVPNRPTRVLKRQHRDVLCRLPLFACDRHRLSWCPRTFICKRLVL